jgi:predicted NUDIX family NTP pyrophosphohydrolase
MAPQSAGILLFRSTTGSVQFLLAHPGGPFWSKKDEGSWSIPKGLHQEHESAIDAARRELQEEIGLTITGDLVELGKFKQPSGKVISAWAAESDFDVAELRSNSFSLEWPPKSGRQMEFPEVDQAGWFSLTEAAAKITRGQLPILLRLATELGLDVSAASKTSSERARRRGSHI